jgi:hypothetical protein
LQHATSVQARGGGVEVIRTLEPSHDLYLQDHQLDHKPVFPMAMALELMAEVVQQEWPELAVVGLRDLQVLRGVVLDTGPKAVRLVAHGQDTSARERPGLDVSVEITDPEVSDRPYYRAVVELGEQWPEAPLYRPSFADGLRPFPMAVGEAYHQWLFQGPRLQGITQIEGIAEQGMTAVLAPSLPSQCLKGVEAGQWLIDPVVFDSGLQLVILWARMHTGMTPLPSRFQRYRSFRPLAGPLVRCHLLAEATPDAHTLRAHLFFVGPDQRLLGVLEDLQCTSSKALNRLAVRTTLEI